MVHSAPPNSGGGRGGGKKRWSNWLPLFVALVVVAEIAFLDRLDMAKNVALVDHWTSSFYFPASQSSSSSGGSGADEGEARCRNWLEREDSVSYNRDLRKEPVLVTGAEQDTIYQKLSPLRSTLSFKVERRELLYTKVIIHSGSVGSRGIIPFNENFSNGMIKVLDDPSVNNGHRLARSVP